MDMSSAHSFGSALVDPDRGDSGNIPAHLGLHLELNSACSLQPAHKQALPWPLVGIPGFQGTDPYSLVDGTDIPM